LLLLLLTLSVGQASISLAQASDETKSASAESAEIDAGREALRDLGNTGWYDSKNDGYRLPDDLVTDDAASRKSDWIAKQRQWNNSNMPQFTWWGSFLSYFTPVLLYGVFPCILILLLLYALQSILPESYQFSRNAMTTKSGVSIDLERISDLPFQVDVSPKDPLSEAKRLMDAGDFERAIIYLFAYQLLQLDANQWIVLQRGKTNRVYLRELRQSPELRSIMETTVLAFEQVFFGRYKLDRSRFMHCWNRLDDFHRQIGVAGEPKASLGLGGLT
jgi:hypothetical protein